MLKIKQIKVPKYTLALQKHPSKGSFETTTKILTMNSTEKVQNYQNMWSLKEEQIMSRIRWSIVEKVYGQTKINFCPLCLAEKVHLIEHFNDNRLLNKRNEFICECRHQVKLLLKGFNRK